MVIGTINNLKGLFFIKDAEGNITSAKNGDVLNSGDILFGSGSNTSEDSATVFLSDNSRELTVLSDNQLLFDETMLSGEIISDTVVASEELDEALLLEEEPTVAEDETQAAAEEQALPTDEEEVALQEIEELDPAAAAAGPEDTEVLSARLEDRTGDETDINTDLRDSEFPTSEVTAEEESVLFQDQTVISISVADPSIPEGSEGMFTLHLSEALLEDVTVLLTYTGTATNGVDYTVDSVVVIPAGETSVDVDVIAENDIFLEFPPETVVVTITEVSDENVVISETDSSVTLEITDDNDTVTVTLIALDEQGIEILDEDDNYVLANAVEEGEAANYKAVLLDSNGEIVDDDGTVDVIFSDGSATGVDSSTAPFANDGTEDYINDPQTVTLGVAFSTETIDDFLAEAGGETFTVSLVDDTFSNEDDYEIAVVDTTAVTTTIIDGDNPLEEDTVTVKLVALDGAGEIIMDGDDYVLANEVEEGVAAKYMAILVDVNGDRITDPEDGTVTVMFGAEGDTATGVLDPGTGVIDGTEDYFNDTQFSVSIGSMISTDTIDDYLAETGGETFTVKLDTTSYAPTGDLLYENVVVDPASVETTIIDESEPGPEDTVTVTLIALDGNGDPILDGDNYVLANEVEEGVSAKYMAVLLDSNGDIVDDDGTVDVVFSDDSAMGVDSSTAPFAINGTEDYINDPQTVTLGVEFTTDTIDDFLAEGSETFTVSLVDDTFSNADDYEIAVVDTTAVTTTITDDTDTIYARIINDDSAAEGGTLTHTVELYTDAGFTTAYVVGAGEIVTVNLSYDLGSTDTADSPGDYTQVSSVQITEGNSTAIVSIDTINDDVIEEDEEYTIGISSVTNNLGSFEDVEIDTDPVTGTVTGTITDNDFLTLADQIVINEINLDSTHEDGRYIEITSIVNNASKTSGFDMERLGLEIVGANGQVLIIDPDFIDSTLSAEGWLMVYEDGTWESFNKQGNLADSGEWTGTVYDEDGSHIYNSDELDLDDFGFGGDTSEFLSVNLIQFDFDAVESGSIDYFIANTLADDVTIATTPDGLSEGTWIPLDSYYDGEGTDDIAFTRVFGVETSDTIEIDSHSTIDWTTTDDITPHDYYSTQETITLSGSDSDLVGTSEPEYLLGDNKDNILTGNDGDDIFDGGLGSDTLIGGAGNDIFVYDSSDTSIDGGSNSTTDDDRLILREGENIDLSAVSMDNIDSIDLHKNGDHEVTGVTIENVMDMTDDADHILRITGDEDDTVELESDWETTSTTEEGGIHYDVYTNETNSSVLHIQEDITINVI